MARFVNDVVDQLDLRPIFELYEREERGYPPYHPAMMLKILVYAYSSGVYSSRKIERRIQEDIAFRYLTAGNMQDFRTINSFRKRHLKAFENLFVQVLQLCQKAGLVKLGTIAIDGTKVQANASKHKAMSYERMVKEEARLQKEVIELLRKAEATDAEEDRRFGSRQGDELPEELAIREKRLAKIREAKQALEAEALAKAESKKTDDDDDPSSGDTGFPGDPPSVPVDGKAQRNFTDPDSRIMRTSAKTFVQGYNAQVAVDAESQVIVGRKIITTSPDVGAFADVLDDVEQNVGRPLHVVADAGYYSEANVLEARKRKIAPFIPPHRVKHSEWRKPGPRGPLPKNATLKQRMSRFLQTQRGKQVYRLRQQSVEPVFGQIKEVRGFRRFSLRGLAAVTCEWDLVTAVHNLLKLFRHACRSGGQQPAAIG